MENLIRQAVELMHRQYDEPLTLDDMASAASMSKFHFIRTFREFVGVTPCRFLGALRIQKSKHLLRTTALNVSDVAVCVGYCSTGSFTRRFSDSVGCSPIHYRAKMSKSRFAVSRAAVASGCDDGGVISGKLLTTAPVAGFRIGVFDTPIAEGKPAALAEADDSGVFTLGPIRPGMWYVHAIGRDPWADERASSRPAPLMVGRSEALTIQAGGYAETEIDVHPTGWNDLPVLFAPLDPDPQSAAVELLAS
jgi:AraC-like DNA-binding protein